MIPYSTPKACFTKNKKKASTWYVAFMFTDPSTEERRRFQFRGDLNLPESDEDRAGKAKAFAAGLANYLKEGWNPFLETISEFTERTQTGILLRPQTFIQALDQCYNLKLQQLTGNESPRTYRYIYKHFRAWLESSGLDRIRPEQFGNKEAMMYSDRLTNEGKKARTFNNYRSIVKIFLNMMVERDLIGKNPLTKVKPAKVADAEMNPFGEGELAEIREYLLKNDYNLYVFCQMIFYLLARPIEVMKLKVKYIDLKKNVVNIPAQISKNRQSRICNIPPALKNILVPWLKYNSVNDYLFTGSNLTIGGPAKNRRSDITDKLKVHLKSLNFDSNLSLYSFKYSGVIAAYVAGISIEEIRIQAGHSSLEMTQIYMKKLGLIKPSSFGSLDY